MCLLIQAAFTLAGQKFFEENVGSNVERLLKWAFFCQRFLRLYETRATPFDITTVSRLSSLRHVSLFLRRRTGKFLVRGHQQQENNVAQNDQEHERLPGDMRPAPPEYRLYGSFLHMSVLYSASLQPMDLPPPPHPLSLPDLGSFSFLFFFSFCFSPRYPCV